jgi:hypothetical protein
MREADQAENGGDSPDKGALPPETLRGKAAPIAFGRDGVTLSACVD